MSEDEPQFSREDYLYLAKIYSKFESFEEMTTCMKNIISLNNTLTKEERSYFSSSQKSFLSEKKHRLIAINGLLKTYMKEDSNNKKNQTKLDLLKELKKSIEREIYQINYEVQEIIDGYLLPKTKNNEDIVFYYKMKADYYRYMHEMSIKGEEDEDFLTLSEEYYLKAIEKANGNLSQLNFVWLSTILNYAIFLGEIKKDKENAIQVAKKIFENAVQNTEDLNNEKNKEGLVVLQLIQENIILWSGGKIDFDGTEDEEEQKDSS